MQLRTLLVILLTLSFAIASCLAPAVPPDSIAQDPATTVQEQPQDATPAPALAETPPSAPATLPISTTSTISEAMPANIHQLKLGPANAYLIEAPAGLILVDTSMSFYARRILQAIEELGKGPLCLIFITHAHIDHYAGADEIRAATGAPVAIHELDAAAMERGDTHLGTVRNWDWTAPVMPWVEWFVKSAPTTPDLLLHDGEPITHCGINGEVVWTPGHTPGSSSLLVHTSADSHIFVGDLISNAGNLRIQTTYADDWALLVPSVDKALSFNPDYFYPGHGDAPVPVADVIEMERRGPATR